jgi:endonuclease G
LDYALLSVAPKSEDAKVSLPPPLQVSSQAAAGTYIGVLGYPDIRGAEDACQTHSASCDETAQWFASYGQKNPGIIKILSPGRETGQFSRGTFQIFTYDAPTLGGQSGSPVMDLETGKVVGLHYCCSGYKAQAESLACAQINPISLGDRSANEAISIKDVSFSPQDFTTTTASVR